MRIVERGGRFAPGDLQQLVVAQQIANPERRQAGLARAEEVARAAELQVPLGDLEAVRRIGEGLEPGASVLREWLLVQEHAVRLVRAASDPAAQLMQLRQAETLGVLDEHH